MMLRAAELVPRLPSRAWLILGGDALAATGSGLTLPFLFIYLHRIRDIELGATGLILSTVAGAGLVGNPVGGWLADRTGARRAVLIGLVLASGGTMAIAAVQTAWHGFAAAALYGVGMAVLWPAQDSLLATSVTPGQRSAVFAMRHATLNAGLGVGGLLAALVVSFEAPATFVLVYLLDAASFLAFAMIVAVFVDAGDRESATEAPANGSYRAVLVDRAFLRLWVLTLLLVAAGYAQLHAGFPGYATGVGGLSARELGLVFAANTLTVVVVQLVVLRLIVGHRRTRGIMLSAGCLAAAWVATLAAGGPGLALILFVVAMMLFAIGETLLSPTLPALVNDLAPETLRGRYNGVHSLAITSGYILGPAFAGFALDLGRGRGLFTMLIGVLAAVAFGAWRLERSLPPLVNLVASQPSIASEAPTPEGTETR